MFAKAGDAMAVRRRIGVAASNLTKMYSERAGAPARFAHHIVIKSTAAATEEEITMSGNKASIVLCAAVVLGVLGTVSAAVAGSDRYPRGGYVMPGSLVGVNPVYHPGIFGNAATAYAYGFVQSRDGTWHVRADWRPR
jgi:hypothetical protein